MYKASLETRNSSNNNTWPEAENNIRCLHDMSRQRRAIKTHIGFNPVKPEFTIVNLHSLQAANCCRNSRLVVDEDDLKWVTKEKKYIVIIRTVAWNFSF